LKRRLEKVSDSPHNISFPAAGVDDGKLSMMGRMESKDALKICNVMALCSTF